MSYSETITRTDLTNILNEVLPVTSKVELEYVGTVNQIHWSEWVAPDDGIIVMDIGWLTGGGFGYYYVKDATANLNVGKVTTYSINGTSNTTSFPVIKGHTYKDAGSSGVNGSEFYFMYYKFKNPTATCGMADFIVEQGTSGIWTYRKWNSGIAECWGRAENNSIPSGWSTTGVNLALPFTFKTMKNWQIQHQNYQVNNCYGYPITISNTYDNINIQTNANEAMSTATFMILCQGTWK